MLGLQLAQRLADRRAAHPEPRAQLVLLEMRARWELAVEDRRLQAERDLVGEAGCDDPVADLLHQGLLSFSAVRGPRVSRR